MSMSMSRGQSRCCADEKTCTRAQSHRQTGGLTRALHRSMSLLLLVHHHHLPSSSSPFPSVMKSDERLRAFGFANGDMVYLKGVFTPTSVAVQHERLRALASGPCFSLSIVVGLLFANMFVCQCRTTDDAAGAVGGTGDDDDDGLSFLFLFQQVLSRHICCRIDRRRRVDGSAAGQRANVGGATRSFAKSELLSSTSSSIRLSTLNSLSCTQSTDRRGQHSTRRQSGRS